MPTTALEYAEKAEKICVLPDVYLRLKELMDDEKATLADIANIIALDPALSSKLLKVANSALFNFPREIDTISKAISILGMEEVHNLINTYGVTEAFSSVNNNVIDKLGYCGWIALIMKALDCVAQGLGEEDFKGAMGG